MNTKYEYIEKGVQFMKMYNNVELILKDQHKDAGVANVEGFAHAKELSTSMITMSEFYEACKNYPIVFSKNEEEGWFSVALLGLEQTNKFVNEDGSWKEDCYIPAYVRRYPFIYVQNKDELLLGFDADHQVDKKEAGDRCFFDDKGEKSEFVDKVLNFMNQVQTSTTATKEFIETLDEMELLEESNITGTNAEGKEVTVTGFWILKEEKLNKLTQKNKTALCKKNYMQPITAHLISLSNIQRLAK